MNKTVRTKVQSLGRRNSDSLTMPSELPFPLAGHCREPPSWEHEDPKRIYHFAVGQTVHYQCAQGFRALHRGSAQSICKRISGKTQWSQPQLKCISERTDSPFPGMEAPAWAYCPAFSSRLSGVEFLTTSSVTVGKPLPLLGPLLSLTLENRPDKLRSLSPRFPCTLSEDKW